MEEVSPAPARARISRLELGVVGLAGVFAVLAGLVATGQLDSLDEYAVVHWMPGLDPAAAHRTIPKLEGVFMPWDLDSPWWHKLLDVVMYPASVAVSLTVFAVGSVVLWRRGSKVAAVVWGATWFVANAIEVLVKVGVEKPNLYRTKEGVSYHIASFDHSFPSGHAMRTVLVAALVAYVWKRFGRALAIWVLVVPICLVAASWHVPSDVIGGVVFGALVVLGVYATIGAVSARRS